MSATDIWYELRHNGVSHTGKLGSSIADVADLRQLVWTDCHSELVGCAKMDLSVYPPNTTDFSQQAARDAETTVEELLADSLPTSDTTMTAAQAARSRRCIIVVTAPQIDLIVNVQWRHRPSEQAEHSTGADMSMPLTVRVEPAFTVGQLKTAVRQQIPDSTTVTAGWLAHRRLRVVCEGDGNVEQNDDVRLSELAQKWVQLCVRMDAAVPERPSLGRPSLQSAPAVEEFRLRRQPIISRMRKLSDLYDSIIHSPGRVSLLRAPPGCGKTSLARQMVHQIGMFATAYHFELQQTTGAMPLFQPPLCLNRLLDIPATASSGQPTVVVVDEAQLSYQTVPSTSCSREQAFANQRLWGQLKSMTSNTQQNKSVYVLLIGAYGSGSNTAEHITPMTIECCRGVDTLLLTGEERAELLAAYSMTERYTRLDSEVRALIIQLLGTHVGLVCHLLSDLSHQLPTVTESSEICHWIMRVARSTLLEHRAVPTQLRSEIKQSSFALARQVLLDLLHAVDEQVSCYTSALHVQTLIRSYYVALSDQETICFPSPFVRYAVTRFLLGPESVVIPPTEFRDFILRSVTGMHHKVLSQSFAHGGQRQLQVDFYRSAYAVMGNCISTDVGAVSGSLGYLDCYYEQLQWGVELMRQGTPLQRHVDRFATEGIYATIPMSERAVLDFHQVEQLPQAPQLRADDTLRWRVYWTRNELNIVVVNGQTVERLLFVE